MVRFRLVLCFLFCLPFVAPGPASGADIAPLQPVIQSDERWGINHIFAQTRLQGMARNTGATWNRWEFRWADMETQRGRLQFGTYDAMVAASRTNGFEVHGILIATPAWATDARTGLPSGLHLPWNDPNNLWARFVRQTAEHYRGQVKNWEIWNEPDYAEIFWNGTTADYYQLLKVAYLAVKSVDPNARVLIGGLAYWPNPGFLPELLQLIMTDPIAKENNSFFDVLVWHTYSRPRDAHDRVVQSKQLLASTVGPRPIWINETNVPAWDESPVQNFRPYSWAATASEQAAYLIQTFGYGLAAGADRLGVYRLQDTEWPEAFGLLRRDGTIRPAYVAYQVAVQRLSHTSSAQLVSYGEVEQIVARRPGERVSVVWNRSPQRLVTQLGALAPSATLVDQAGTTTQLRASQGQFRLDLAPATANHGVNESDFFIGGAPLIVVESLPGNLATAQESNLSLAYSGSWETIRAPGASEGATARSTTSGQGAAVEFAQQITWVTSLGPDRGIARVEVDGVLQAEIDLYDPEERWDVPYTFGEFGPGGHRATITATGRRSTRALGAFVDVDAMVGVGLQGTSLPPEPAPVVANATGARPPFTHSEAAVYSATEPVATAVALPLVTRARDGWTTLISIQHGGLAPQPATIRYRNGAGVETASQQVSLVPNGSVLVDPRSAAGLGDGFGGAATIESAAPIGVTVTQVRDGSDSLSYSGFALGGDRVYAPLLFKAANGWSSSLHLQNLASNPAPVSVSFRSPINANEVGRETLLLPPNGSASLALGASAVLSPGFAGAAVVEAPAGARIVGLVTQQHESGSVASYEGAGSGSSALHVPLLFKNANGWDSGLQVQNVGNIPTGVVITYHSSDSRGGTWTERTIVPAGAALTSYQPANPQLPDGFVGSAVITSTNAQPLVAVVHQVSTARGAATSYRAVGEGATLLSLAYMARNAEGWNTGVQVQNLGSEPTTLILLLQAEDGVLVHRSLATASPGASRTFYVPALAGIPDGWRGSATVLSLPEQRVAAVVNETRYEPGAR